MPVTHIAEAILKALADWGSAMFPAFAHAAAPVAVAALWQGAAVAVALVLCLRLAPRISAAHRFTLWAAGFAVVVGLPLLPLFGHSSVVGAAGPIHEAVAKPLMHPLMHLDIRWAFIIAAVWMAASVFRAGELAFHTFRLRRLWKSAAPVEIGTEIGAEVGVEINSRVRELAGAHSDARRIEICTTRDLDRPSVIGFFAPRILIPEWLFSRLTPGELEQVVLHETEHLRRRDDWTNLLQKLSLVLFPLNPALIWMERRLCREREMACDEGVVRRTHAPRAYAACLTTLAERGLQQRELLRRAHALSLGAFTRRPELVHRVHSILRRKQALNPLLASALVGVVGFGLVAGAVELSRSPQLVAFVATPEADAQVAALARQSGPEGIHATDAVYHPSEHYRAIETKAIVAPGRNAVANNQPRRGSNLSLGISESVTTGAKVAPREMPANATTPIPAETAALDQGSQDQGTPGQEFLVLTTWEEVRTSTPHTSLPQADAQTARTIADYETGAGAQQQIDAAPSQRDAERNAQITVTRLIFVIYPASAGAANGVTGARPAPTTDSPAHRPTASYGGWLFFQL